VGLGEEVEDWLALVGDGEGAFAGGVEDLVEGETEGVADGGVEVGDFYFVFGDVGSGGVGGAVDVAAADAAAGHHAGEGLGVVVAAFVDVDLGRAPELGGEDDEGLVE